MRLHHVGILVSDLAAGDMLAWAMGYSPRSVPLRDPEEQAVVQLHHHLGEDVYMEVVTADGPESHLVGKPNGLHHLCFSVESIERAGAKMRGCGMIPVGKPRQAPAFGDRRTAWFSSATTLLVELLEE